MSRTEASRNMGGHAPSATAGVPPAFVVIIAGMVAALHIGKIPPAIPVLRDALGVSLVEAGFLLSMVQMAGMLGGVFIGLAADGFRSEEHTSELQSRENLVCRLLLEKKKNE